MSVDDIEKRLHQVSYGRYEDAVNVQEVFSQEQLLESSSYNLYSWKNVKPMLFSLYCLLELIIAPYMMIICCLGLLLMYFWQLHFTWFSAVMAIIAVYNIAIVICEHCSYMLSPSSGQYGWGSFGGTLQSGLYRIKSPAMDAILQHCPVITSNDVLNGDLVVHTDQGTSTYKSTPWIFCGNVRTLIPFCTFKHEKVPYRRRWIRVPLSDRNKPKEQQEGQYEAVALDWLPPRVPSKDGKVKAMLMLAGLTGGSEEGYILDMVNAATKEGYHCFVMVARGLGGTPLHSNVLFHGARVDDIVEAAKSVRICLGNDAHIIAVGISMGGIIVANSCVRTEIHQYIDSAISIAGCMDTRKNVHFRHTRELWQPLLAHGLKEAFAVPKRYWKAVEKIFGEKLEDILDRIRDVYDFDGVMVTHLNNFNSVNDYYSAMCANVEQLTDPTNPGIQVGERKGLGLRKPLLVVNTKDDPIIHVDTTPTHAHDPSKPLLVENLAILITETGGHVGWPLGLFPWQHGFKLMAHLVLEFSEASLKNKK